MSSGTYTNPVFPPPSPGVQTAVLRTQIYQSPTNNNLRVYALGLPSLRRVRVVMRVSPMTNQVTVPQRWWVNCYCALAFPEKDLSGSPNELHMAPSLVTIPSLGAPIMHVVDLFLPRLPIVSFVNFFFSTELKDPNAQTLVWGYPESRPHDYDGLFLVPYGSGIFLRRKHGDGGDDDDEHALELESLERDTRQDKLEQINPNRNRRRGL